MQKMRVIDQNQCYIQFFELSQMSFEVQSKTFKWLLSLKTITPADVKQLSSSSFQIKQETAVLFQNGIKISMIVSDIYKRRGLPLPPTINHLKQSSGTAAQLYNWNILNDSLRKIGFQIDSETKNLIINGDRVHLAMVLRKLHSLSEADPMEDSLETEQFQRRHVKNEQSMKQSLTLSRSEDPGYHNKAGSIVKNIQSMRQPEQRSYMAKGDLLQFVVNELTQCLKLSRKQAVALLSDNNKYLAHVVVKGVKGQFQPIDDLMQRFYEQIDYIVEKMIEQNDMCYYFLQIIKPSLLSKSEEIAQWGCRILTKIAHILATKQMLPLAYDWFVQQTGGLSTTILALTRHPKLNQHVVGYILEFSRYNVAQLFTIQLKKITNNDNLTYVKFMLLIFNPLTQSKISAQQLLQSGAIDYWIQITLKGAQNAAQNSNQLRMYCIQFLIKIWRAYPAHIEQTLDQVNNIMNQIKKGIREDSQIMRFTLMEMMFQLLDEFASKKNPYASIVYKKITFLFIENHQELTIREFMLRNLQAIFEKYQSIPVQIFLEPFIKQIKISQSKSYLVNLFDIEFIYVAVKHRKLKVTIGLELFDLLAKTKLNSYSFSIFATQAMQILIDRFLHEDIFLQYTVKLVKISLAMLYSTLKHKKPYQDQQRLQAQKRAQIINFIISLIERGNNQLNEEIKNLVVHVKVQILNRLGIEHKGVERILGFFADVDEAVMEAMQNARDQTSSNATETTKEKSGFHLPKIQPRNMLLRDQTASQHSLRSSGTKYSQNSQFPQKDYTDFASDDQRKFLKQNGLGLKKRVMTKKRVNSHQKQVIDPKIQQHIMKIKMRKQQDERKKAKQKEHLQRKKQVLKQKIQKQLQQRNVKQGYKGHEKDVEVRVLFEDNQINQNILEDDENHKWNLNEEEDRDHQSVKIVLKKYAPFVKKIFTRYCNIKGNKKDYFDGENQQLMQIDLVRLCKEKNIEKNKNVIIEIMRHSNNKNVTSLGIQGFFKFLQSLCMQVYVKEKCSSKILMGDLMRKILRRMSQGQNFKMDEDDDQACKNWSERVRYNPHIELPENLKKIYERVYKVHDNCSYPVKKAVKEQYSDCYQIINQILKDALQINTIQQEVRFVEEARVVVKKQYYMPPKPLKKEKQQNQGVSLLQDKEKAPQQKAKRTMNKSISKKATNSFQKQNDHSRSKSKIINQAEKKKQQDEEQMRRKRQIQEQQRKQRALEVKRKLQKQQQERQKEKQKKKLQKKEQQQKQQERKRREKERKQRYLKQQKQKVEKYKRDQESRQKQQKVKTQQEKQKEQEQRKTKLKEKMKKEEEKRKQQFQQKKRERQLSEERNKKKKQEEQRKKQNLKKQMMKKMEGQKQKLEFSKQSKETMMKIYRQPEISELVNNKYKQQFKAIFNYGKQFNEFKLDKGNTNVIEQKGWINLCQQLGFCDVTTANKIIKMHVKEKNTSGISQEDMQQILFELAVRKEVQSSMQDYEKAKNVCHKKFDQYIGNLKLPKTGQRLKEYFIGLKNQVSNKKKEEMTVTNPDGQKQTWEINQ